ncbi:MAG: hypothetical protein IJT98_01115 [Prevotella sp.]|nr:hypothetical protein [Prevotella sp.]
MLIDDYNYFDQHRKELAEQYPDKWLLIKDEKVLFAVDTLLQALDTTYKNGMKEGDCLTTFCRKDGKKKIVRIGRAHVSPSNYAVRTA